MTSADPLSLVGTTVSEKYEIERVVGEGGFAVVYRARHTVWNRPVAIKVFRALVDLPHERRRDLVDSFIQEGRLLADLSERSAAICQARDVGTLTAPGGREIPYMVLEWLEGRSLEQVLEAEKAARMPPRTPEQALRILEPAAEALELAHRKGIAHRDVKPANIFILGEPRGDFTVKLLDFGIAKVVQDAQRLGGSFAQTQGVVSSFTPAYGAPEQFSRSHGSTGPWTDVFALALIFTELMTHEPPLRGDDLTQLAFMSMDPRRRPTPRTYGANVSDAVEAVLRRALAVAPDDRFRSMGELWDALRAALAMEPSRAFATIESSRSNPQLTALVASSSAPYGSPGADPAGQALFHDSLLTPGPVNVGATGPMMPAEGARVTAQPTMPAAGGGPLGAPPSASGTAGLGAPGLAPAPARPRGGAAALVAVVAGVLVLAGLVGAGLWAFSRRGGSAVATDPVASSASSGAPAPPPPPTCPEGMTKIPGGKFFMGSDDRRDEESERPAHQVTLSAYCMDTTEVTVAQYKACSDRGECKRAPTENDWEGIDDAAHELYDPLCTIRDPEALARHPINCLDWELADAFCKAVGKRLPTEAEWEFATRGSDGRKYPWGDEPPTSGAFLNACGKECVAWGKKHPDPDNPLEAMYAVDDGFPTTAPAGSFPDGGSPFGLQDVVGNVWEWVGDWYAPYGAEPTTDPAGPATGTERVLRGGAWNGSDPSWVRPTYRFKSDPKLRSHGIGVRCAKAL
ncbi:MAG: SUMF1/EgtB/PvdO family nonheme iron enzyme [Labilithrix sp.]|nr:SUMF1/EgtB/PvdO family nonheme iron enzyme [Labilithrix sp.]